MRTTPRVGMRVAWNPIGVHRVSGTHVWVRVPLMGLRHNPDETRVTLPLSLPSFSLFVLYIKIIKKYWVRNLVVLHLG